MTCDATTGTQSGVKSQKIEYLPVKVVLMNIPSVHRMMVISLTISKVTVVQWSVQVPSPKTDTTAHVSC